MIKIWKFENKMNRMRNDFVVEKLKMYISFLITFVIFVGHSISWCEMQKEFAEKRFDRARLG